MTFYPYSPPKNFKSKMRFIKSKLNLIQRDEVSRIFVSEQIKILNNNLVKFVGGSEIKMNLSEVLSPSRVEEKTGNEIVEDLTKKLSKITFKKMGDE